LNAILEGKCACTENAGARSSLIYSEASSSASANGWGGVRNHAGRISEHIKLETALELVDAARWAMTAGVPFNRHMTIHWAMSGIPDSHAAAATGRLVKLIRDWVKKRGGNFAHGWVREMGQHKGSHAHILLHLPKDLRLGHMTRRWVRSIAGVAPRRAIKTKAIGGTASAAFSGSDWYECNLAAVIAYVLKGVSPETGATLGLNEFAKGGPIIGKRLSISQNLRPAGRGWANPSANPLGKRLGPNSRASTVEPLTKDRGWLNACELQSGQRSESSVKTLTPFFCESLRARARARPEPENQNFADDLGETGEAA
jgi:hypothetical protein